jgi:microcystin-dependent protein
MAKTKISEFDVDPSNNTDINSINIAEGCAPSGINNAIRQLMSDLKEFQTGAADDDFTVGGDLVVDGTSTFTGGIVGGGFVPTGGIIIWSGAADAIPSGWLLCNGSSGTPDLRNRFVVGAGSTYSVGGTGGSADAIVVSHTHSITDAGHAHSYTQTSAIATNVPIGSPNTISVSLATANTSTATTGITIDSEGSSGTNANLPPYYALCYIMKS